MKELKNAGKLLTIRDLARILGISERTIYNRIRKNAELPFPIKAKRIGRLIRFAPEDVQRYLDKL
jgi:excisionase family DNA binding protein